MTIPAFNHGRYIGAAIESALGQDADLDVLVVDDHSPDNTLEVVSRYASDPRIRCVRNDDNLGLARNWNRCLELARGPLVMVLGDDDLLDPGYLKIASRIFEVNPRVGVVHAPVRTVNSSGEVVKPGTNREARHYFAGDEAVTAILEGGLATVTTVLRRECYDRLGAYDEGIRNSPDLEFVARIAAHYDVYDVGCVQGSFRWHANKWGHLSYLEDDALDIWVEGERRLWNHLTDEGQHRLGVRDFDTWIQQRGARYAYDGALACVAHSRRDRARYYLREAMRLDPGWWKQRKFWQTLALGALPVVGPRWMRRRMTGEA